MAMKMRQQRKEWLFCTLVLAAVFAGEAQAQCAGNGQLFPIKEGVSQCIMLGRAYGPEGTQYEPAHRIVHCTVSGLQQSSYLLVSHTDFIADTPYHLPQEAIYITHNEQRIVFTGLALTPRAEVVFHYFGPWDPSYQFDLTCSW